MNRDELIALVNAIIDSEKLEMALYVVLSDNSVKLLDMDSDDLTSLIKDYTNDVRKKICTNEYTLKAYSTADERRNCYFTYDLEEKPEEFSHIMSAGNEEKSVYFSTKDNALKEITALIAVLSSEGRRLKVYKKINPLEKMAVKDRRFYIVKDDQRFVKASEDMININPAFSILWINDTYVLTDIDKLEKSLGLTSIITNEATRLVDTLKAINLIADLNVITQYTGTDLALAKKIIATIRNSPVLRNGIKNDKIILFAKNKASKLGKISIDEKKGQFTPKHKTEVKRIFKILNDDYLRSELTEEEYDSVVKDKWEVKPE